MSHAIVWEFLVPEAQRVAFEAAYGPDGPWALLFRQAPGFLEVKLLRSQESAERYLTIDRWESNTAFENFKSQFAREYQALDRQLEGLASSELRVGAFDDLPSAG